MVSMAEITLREAGAEHPGNLCGDFSMLAIAIVKNRCSIGLRARGRQSSTT